MTRGEVVRLLMEWDEGDLERRAELLAMVLAGVDRGAGAFDDNLNEAERALLGLAPSLVESQEQP